MSKTGHVPTSTARKPPGRSHDMDGPYDEAVDALVIAVEQFVRLGAIQNPAAFVRDVARRLADRFPLVDGQSADQDATRVTPSDADGLGADTLATGSGEAQDQKGSLRLEPQKSASPVQSAPPSTHSKSSTGSQLAKSSGSLPARPPPPPVSPAAASPRPHSAGHPSSKKRRAGKFGAGGIAKLVKAVTGVPLNLTQTSPPVLPPVALPAPELEEPPTPQPPEPPSPIADLGHVEAVSSTTSQDEAPGAAAVAEVRPLIEVSPAIEPFPPIISLLEPLPEAPPARSNVRPVSNVYLRTRDGPAQSDEKFRRQIRGADWIKDIYVSAGVLNPSLSIGSQDLSALSPRQQDEVKDFTCIYGCGRRDFGYIRLPDGRVKWGSLARYGRQCRCRRTAASVDTPAPVLTPNGTTGTGTTG